MAQYKPMVTPVLTHWSYHSLVVSHQYHHKKYDECYIGPWNNERQLYMFSVWVMVWTDVVIYL